MENKTKGALIVIIILVVAIILGVSGSNLSGNIWKENWIDVKLDSSQIIDGKSQSFALGEHLAIENVVKSSDRALLTLLEVDKGEGNVVLEVKYENIVADQEETQEKGLVKYGADKLDVDKDGLMDLEIRLEDIPSEGKAVIFVKLI